MPKGNTKEGGAKAKATQIAKYGGLEGYSEEMKRRRKLANTPGFNSERAKAAVTKKWERYYAQKESEKV